MLGITESFSLPASGSGKTEGNAEWRGAPSRKKAVEPAWPNRGVEVITCVSQSDPWV